MDIKIDPVFSGFDVTVHLAVMTYDVSVTASPQGLLDAVKEGSALRRDDLMGEAASTDPAIASVRAAFREIGKDPSRYRPSSEALTRRILAGKDLYTVNNVVDCGNLASLMTGVPVGCYNADAISGDVTLTVGQAGDSYTGIGRGDINVAGLPVLKDDIGFFGTPYGDSLRTAITDKTEKLLFVLYGLNLDVTALESAGEMADTLLTAFAIANNTEPAQ